MKISSLSVITSLLLLPIMTIEAQDRLIHVCVQQKYGGIMRMVAGGPGDCQKDEVYLALQGYASKVTPAAEPLPEGGEKAQDARYAKMNAAGDVLPDDGTSWACLKDKSSGLVWEIKTDDGGLRDKDNTFSWYNPDNKTNSGHAGAQNGGSCTGGIACDTYSYVQAVNSLNPPLCGSGEWRLPTVEELNALRDIDGALLPDAQSRFFWSASSSEVNPVLASGLDFGAKLNFWAQKNTPRYVRLVKGGGE